MMLLINVNLKNETNVVVHSIFSCINVFFSIKKNEENAICMPYRIKGLP